MQIHEIKPIHKPKKPKRVGRGGKKGTYSGRGIKGQKSRAGRKLQPIIRELIKRYHKVRGYNQKTKIRLERVVNVDVLDKKFNNGDIVTPDVLVARKIIRPIKSRFPEVKILGRGEIKTKLIIRECSVSENAKKKIEAAGGKIE